MKSNEIITGVLVDEKTTFSVSEICTRCNVPHELLVQMMEYGLFEFTNQLEDDYNLDLKTLRIVESAVHLHRDLEINMPGIALILELKDELEQLRNELDLLHKHLSRP